MAEVEMSANEHAKAVLAEMDPRVLLGELEPWVRWRGRLLVCGLALLGYGRAKVICGYRTLERCERLFGQGRTEAECLEAGVPGEYASANLKRVTWIRPEFNRHHRRRALDVDFTMYTDLNDDAIECVARSVGMMWGGVWSARDAYHFEV